METVVLSALALMKLCVHKGTQIELVCDSFL